MKTLPGMVGCLATALLLTACGGGGSGTATAPPPSPTSQDQANAQAAKMTAAYDIGSHSLTLSWTDAFAATTGFQIEQQQADGTWSKLDSVPGGSGSQPTLTWSRAVTTAGKFRVEAVMSGYNVPLSTAASAQSVDFTPPAAATAITLGATQPIAVPTDLSIAGGGTYSNVTYKLDGQTLGTTTVGPAYVVSLNPGGFVVGAHQLQALLTVSTDLTLVLAESVQLASPELAVSFEMSGPFPDSPGHLQVIARASSDFGITAVEAFQDSKSLGVLTSPNGCSKQCQLAANHPPILDEYVFDTNSITAGSGKHLISVHATDGNGQTGSVSQQVVYSNPPTVSITAPIDGALVNGNLTLTGTATTDKTGTLTTVVTLNGTQILSTTSTSLSTTYSLGSLAAGTYSLRIVATDADGTATIVVQTVTNTSAADLVFTPLATLGETGTPLAAEGSTVVVRMGDGSFHLRSGSTDTTLQNTSSLALPHNWKVANGNVFVTATGDDRLPSSTSVYWWAADGSRKNLSTVAGSTVSSDQLVTARGPWVAFLNDTTSYSFYNVTTAQKLSIPKPAAAQKLSSDGDIFLSGGNLVLFYAAVTGQTASAVPASDIFRWDQATAVSTQLTTATLTQGAVQTDGTRAAWASSATGFGTPPANLVTLDIASNTQTALSTILNSTLYLVDGLLSWQEKSASAGGVTVSDGTNQTVVSNRLSSVLYGSGMGYVLFEDAGVLKYWSAAGGAKTLFDGTPGHALFSGRTAYFTNGASQTLYAVPLP